jgi:hypothetical protein
MACNSILLRGLPIAASQAARLVLLVQCSLPRLHHAASCRFSQSVTLEWLKVQFSAWYAWGNDAFMQAARAAQGVHLAKLQLASRST